MYLDYFGLRDTPFSLAPDPRFFYTNSLYQEASASLLYGIRERKGFVVVTGEAGTGKTTLLRWLMSHLEKTTHVVFFYNTTLTFDELLSFACGDVGLPVREDGRLRKIQALNDFLLAQLQDGGTGVLLIDEAQNLSDEVLGNLHHLGNLEMAGKRLLQIVLVGGPELEVKLAQPNLRQLKQRVAIYCRLASLKEHEVGPFIRHRLRTVGCERQDLFSPEALQRVAWYSQGIPRLVNVICDNALLVAYRISQQTVSAAIIEEVTQDLGLKTGLEEAKGDADRDAVSPSAPIDKQPLRQAPEVVSDGVSVALWPSQEKSPPLFHKPSRLPRARLAPMLILLLLSGAVATVYLPLAPSRPSGLRPQAKGFLGTAREQLITLQHNLSGGFAAPLLKRPCRQGLRISHSLLGRSSLGHK